MSRKLVSLCGGAIAVALLMPAVPGVAAEPEGPEAVAAGRRTGPAGGLDPRFGSAGTTSVPLSSTSGDRFFASAVGRGNRTYAAGFVTTTGSDQAMAVARIRPDGSLDTTFGDQGSAVVNVAPGRGTLEAARGVAVQANGKVLVGGPAESTDPGADPKDADIYVSRFTDKGLLDPTFGNDGTFKLNLSPGAVTNPTTGSYRTDLSYGLVVLPGDKVFVVATRGPGATPGRLDRDFAFIQLTRDGALDPSFGEGGITFVDTTGMVNGVEEHLNESARQALVQPDGKIVVGSYSEGSNGSAIPRVIRLLRNGDLDPTFGEDGIATAPLLGTGPNETEFYDIARQGRDYIVTGYGRPGLSGTVDMIAARFKADGTWDRSFGDDGVTKIDLAGQDDRGRDLVVFPDGRALLVGSGKRTPTELDAMAVMLTRDGALDTSFDGDGILEVDLGGPNDAFFGATEVGPRSAFLAGYEGAASPSGDDAAVARVLASTPRRR